MKQAGGTVGLGGSGVADVVPTSGRTKENADGVVGADADTGAKISSPVPPKPSSTASASRERRIAMLRQRLGAMTSGRASSKAKRSVRPTSRERHAEQSPGDRSHAFVPQGRVTPRTRVIPRTAEDQPAVRVFKQSFDAHHRHGTRLLTDVFEQRQTCLADLALDPALAGVDPQRLLYFDTETTGLAGGAGTIPFLIGLGWFEQGEFKVEQQLLCTPGHETKMLRRLAELVSSASAIVSYNGKSFDWPLIRTRFVLNRLSPPALPPHFDLLHAARRMFGRRLGRVRLIDVEERVLDFTRINDIDGALIPSTYFAYLQGAQIDTLAPVVEHNVHDIVALAAMLGVMLRQLDGTGGGIDARDSLSAAHVALRAGLSDRALEFAESAAEAARDDPCAVDALCLAARLRKREGQYEQAAQLLARALPLADRVKAAEVHLGLAKLFEHNLGDIPGAMMHAQGAAGAESYERQQSRIARLARRGPL